MICQDTLPFKPWMLDRTRKLPGIQPVPAGEWLLRDEVFDQQMAYRDHLLVTRRRQVFQATSVSLNAQKELLDTILHEIGGKTKRPDGVTIDLDADFPIICAARFVQEDLLILENDVLSAAVLCFPASWTLAEKFGRGMVAIHGVVDEYTDDMAKRVKRMFDAIRPEQPLWRANFMIYADAELHQPRLEADCRPREQGRFVRVERQTLRRLPETKAVVFGIHTYVVPLENLTDEERSQLSIHNKGDRL